MIDEMEPSNRTQEGACPACCDFEHTRRPCLPKEGPVSDEHCCVQRMYEMQP